ncbi:ATP-binding protein [Kordia algicida OT-1]|uniref:histidine kinase n=1 Tax=Kordia algicida OT-1 TaxID=391587 RepID=A9DPW6_9FLAO|nr:ATP-binding protein [Kordia algicida]EDP97540.1 putative transmembrane protein [Kordia algicida OT-1]
MKKNILIYFLLYTAFLMAQNTNVSSAEAIELFEKYEKKSEYFNDKRKLDSTELYLEKLDKLLPKINDSSYNYRADLIRGSVLTRKTKSDEAMKILLKAAEFFKLQEDYSNYYRARFKIGICYYYASRRDKAQKLMMEVYKNKQYVGEDMSTRALANYGAVDVENGMHPRNDSLLNNAIGIFEKTIKINKKNQNYTRVASNFSLLAESYNQLAERETALQYLDSAIYYARKDKNLGQKGFALIKKAHILTENKQYDKAEKMLNEAIKTYDMAADNPSLLYAYLEKKILYTSKKDYKAASLMGDSIFDLAVVSYDKRFADGISEMEVKYKTADKERQILEQRTEIAEKGLKLQERQYQFYGALALALLFCVLGYLFYNQQKLKNRQLVKENKLKVALKEIETQNKLQEQRLRISRDLHDNIGAQLSFIISSIDNLKYASKDSSDAFKDKLSYISEFTMSTIDQLRDTIWAMNKDEISLTDLQSRTLAFIEKAKVAKQHIKFKFNNEVETTIQFTAIEGMHLFRVIQEAINNSLKYANANTVTIHFSEVSDQLVIHIKDDGIGFEKEAVQLGNGLYNMQKRMDEINAHIDINSTPSEGTEIIVKYHV